MKNYPLMNYYYSFCWCFQGVCSEYHLVVRYWLSWCLGASGDHSPTPTSSSLLYNVHPIFYQQHLGHWAVLFVMPALYSARHCPTVVLTPASSTRHRPPKTYSISDCIHSLELQRIDVLNVLQFLSALSDLEKAKWCTSMLHSSFLPSRL